MLLFSIILMIPEHTFPECVCEIVSYLQDLIKADRKLYKVNRDIRFTHFMQKRYMLAYCLRNFGMYSLNLYAVCEVRDITLKNVRNVVKKKLCSE